MVEFETIAIDDVIDYIIIGTSTVLNINIDVNETEANIQAAIEAALDSAGVNYSSVSVTKTDIGGGLFSFIIIVYESDYLINIIGISGNDYAFALEECNPNPPGGETDFELREDGTVELREDLAAELRE